MADWELAEDPLVALRDGDPGPFEAFVRSHARRLFAFFQRRGAGLHLAEDLTQEVFLKLHQHAPRYRAEERFQAYCLRVARNVWIDAARRRAARGRHLPRGGGAGPDADREPELPEAAERTPGAALEVREEGERIRSALSELSPEHRAVFELGVVEELPYAEIARLLDVPVGTVKSRMFHAVRRLRRAVGADEEETG